MRIDIITIFPEYFSPLGVSLLGKAAARGAIALRVHDLRNWAGDAHHTVDDAPFGGGPGMVMAPGPWGAALDAVIGDTPGARLVVPTPSGIPFTQASALKYSRVAHLVFACGRYEGIDARVVADARERMEVDEVTIGDYVLSGGEPAALVMIDAVCPAAARRAGQRQVGAGRLVRGGLRADGRSPRRARLHQAARLAGPRGAARPAVWRPRGHCPVAARSGAAPDRGLPSGPGGAAGRRPGKWVRRIRQWYRWASQRHRWASQRHRWASQRHRRSRR